MTDLVPPTQSLPQKRPTTPELGKALSELLDATGSPDDASRQIAQTPALLDEAKAVLPALKATATAKAGPDGVRRVIAKRFETYPQPQRTDEQWAAWWDDYFDVLEDIPLASLEAGMRAYVADPASEFMPKPGRLRELAFTAPCRALGRFYRATRAIQLSQEAEAVRPTAEDVEAIRRMAAETAAKLAPPKPQKPELPSIAGKPDDGGLTPQMRDLMARRAAR